MRKLQRHCVLAVFLTVASLSDAQPISNPALTPLAFLSGRWVSDTRDEAQEETWSPVRGDSMTGSFRILQRGKPVFYEFWAVEIEAAGPVLKLKHFNANLVGWEEKADSTKMPLVSTAKNDAEFAEPDRAVSLHYHRSADTLTCTVHHVSKGKESDEVFRLTRAPGY